MGEAQTNSFVESINRIKYLENLYMTYTDAYKYFLSLHLAILNNNVDSLGTIQSTPINLKYAPDPRNPSYFFTISGTPAISYEASSKIYKYMADNVNKQLDNELNNNTIPLNKKESIIKNNRNIKLQDVHSALTHERWKINNLIEEAQMLEHKYKDNDIYMRQTGIMYG